MITNLWRYLKRYAPTFEHKKLEKALIIKYLYKENTPKATKRFNDLTVTFCKLFEQYILIQNLDNNENYRERILINAFGERRLDKAFYKTISTAKKQIEQKEVKDISDYEQLLFLESERYYYPQTSKYDMQYNGMQTILDTISDYSQLLAFKSMAEVKQTEMGISKEFNLETISNIINFKSETTNTLAKIYQLIIELATYPEQNWNAINELMNIFKGILPKIQDREEQQYILSFLINYAVIHQSNDIRYY